MKQILLLKFDVSAKSWLDARDLLMWDSNVFVNSQDLSEPELLYRLRKTFVRNVFSDQFRKLINKRTGYNLNDMRETAYLVVYPITVNFAALLITHRRVGPQT